MLCTLLYWYHAEPYIWCVNRYPRKLALWRSQPWRSLTHGELGPGELADGSQVVMWWLCISCSAEAWNFDFLIKFYLEGQGQSPHKTIGILTKVFCTSGPNLAIRAWMGDELWCGQASNGVNWEFEGQGRSLHKTIGIFDLEGQGQSLHKTIGILTKVFCTFDPNLLILARTTHELLRGQASDWHTDWHTRAHTHTHTHTEAGNDNTQRPKLDSGENEEDSFEIIS